MYCPTYMYCRHQTCTHTVVQLVNTAGYMVNFFVPLAHWAGDNILKALAGTSWGQQKETLLMTYKAVGCSIANYAAPVWSTNASNTSMEKIQVAQNEALRISTGAHKMSSIDHLHCEAQMLKVTEHPDLLSAQYLVKCLDHENVCHNITTLDQPPRMMKHTLYSKHHTTIAPLLADTTKESLKAVHTAAVSKSRRKQDSQ